MRRSLILLGLAWAFALVRVAPAAAQGFGSTSPELVNMKGVIYALPEDTETLPAQIERQKPLGVIFTDKLDIPGRDFTEGFPGVSDRFEWFGIIYTGMFEIAQEGDYVWKLLSDEIGRAHV